MKKLMIACAAVAFAAAAHAAACAWSGANVTLAGQTGGPTSWGIYLIDSAKLTTTQLSTLFQGTDKDALASAISGATVLTTAGVAAGTAGRWSVPSGALPAEYVNGQNVTFYTLILDQGGVQDQGAYLLSDTKSGTVSDSTTLAMGFLSQAGKTWTAYEFGGEPPIPSPEPTSGLLLLLGVAGLALRRKQA